MIYCPKCETANRDGSRFCNACGAPLPHTGVRCPECNATNPTGNVFCDYCGTRLIAPSAEFGEKGGEEEQAEESGQAPIKGLSLPTIPLDEEPSGADAAAPAEDADWLSELRATMAEEEGEAAPEPDFEAAEEGEIPDWLMEATGPVDEAESQQPSPAPPPRSEEEPEAPPPEPETPDWLAASEPEEPSAEEPPVEEEPAAAGVPDWLAELDVDSPFEPAPEDEEPPPPEEGPAMEAEPPDWLADLDIETPLGPPAAEGEPSIEAPQPEEMETPDWMMEPAEEVSTPPTAEPEPAAAEPPVAAELPDWLAELSAQTAPAPSPTEDQPPAEAEMPDWLAELGAQAEAAPSAEETSPPGEAPPPEPEAPDWLVDLDEGSDEEEPPAPEAEVPDWLADLEEESPATPPSEGISPFAEASLAEADVPDWLRELEEPGPSAGPSPPAVDEADIPDWLREAAPTEGAPPRRPPARPGVADEGMPDLEPGEIPDWLMPLKPGAGEPSVRSERLTPAEAGLAPADIPDWLQAMRPRAEAAAPKERVEEEGLLEGLRGTLPPSPLIEATGKVEASTSEATAAAVIARAELLQELLSRPAPLPQWRQEEKEREERRRSTGWTIQYVVVALLLLAAILAPQIAEWVGFEIMDPEMLLAAPRVSEQVVQVYQAIESQVQPGAPVLIAFEYSAAEADEMDAVAAPLVHHLLMKEAQVLFVSTYPQGPMLAERLGDHLIARGDLTQAAWDEQVVNLGYFPAQATGVQNALLDLGGGYWPGSDEPARLEGLSSAEDVALILVLAGQPTRLQNWIEQISTLSQAPPLLAGISARVGPLSRPYLQGTQQLQGAVTGWVDAAAYENQIQLDGGQATGYLQSLTLVRLLVSGLMVTGAVIFLIGGRGR